MKTEAKEEYIAYNDYRVYNNVYVKRRVNKRWIESHKWKKLYSLYKTKIVKKTIQKSMKYWL